MPQPDPLGKYFAGSLGMHAALIGLVVLSGVSGRFQANNNWGSEHASSGSVGVTMVKTIPIPHKEAPENPLANDTESNVPQAPVPVKLALPQQVKAPDPKAIEIPDKVQRKVSPKQQSRQRVSPTGRRNTGRIRSIPRRPRGSVRRCTAYRVRPESTWA